MKSDAVSPMMHKLSAHIAAAAARPLPKEVVSRAKLHIVDTFAAMISGSRLLPGQKAIAYAKTLGGKPVAGIVGTRLVTTPQNAALANGMFGHADETDDTHPPSLTHPGTSVTPAALAIGEARGLSGDQVLRAIVLATTSARDSSSRCTRCRSSDLATTPAHSVRLSAPPRPRARCSASMRS